MHGSDSSPGGSAGGGTGPVLRRQTPAGSYIFDDWRRESDFTGGFDVLRLNESEVVRVTRFGQKADENEVDPAPTTPGLSHEMRTRGGQLLGAGGFSYSYDRKPQAGDY